MKFVNSYQSKKERRLKYNKVLENGFSTTRARRLRDWTKPHVDEFIKLNKKLVGE